MKGINSLEDSVCLRTGQVGKDIMGRRWGNDFKGSWESFNGYGYVLHLDCGHGFMVHF